MNIKNLVRVVVPLLISLIGVVAAQEVTDAKPLLTIFPHPEGRFWISGQLNFILQGHGRFPALYSGPNSLKDTSEHALSRVLTLYTGVEVRRGTELLFDVEDLSGHGISDALGLAGFTNVDVVRNPDLGPKPYIARIMLHHTIALSGEQAEQEPTPFSISKMVPTKRLEIRIGKLSAADFFDTISS